MTVRRDTLSAKGVWGMAWTRLRKALSWRYRRFVRRQGFVVMTVICAAVIAGSAAWTRQAGFQRLNPSPLADDAQSAADLWQQSLQSAATETPAVTAPPAWHSPLTEITVLQGFDAERLVPTGIPGLWRVHDAVDLAASESEAIMALRDGTVLEATAAASGVSVVIDHGDGCVAEYAELSRTDCQAGQEVSAGETVGYAGEAHGQGLPCLHLRITQDAQPIDPMTLLALSQP